MTITRLTAAFTSVIEKDQSCLVVGHNLHSVYLYHVDQEFRSLYDRADIVLSDGKPVALDYKFSGGSVQNERTGSTDWIPRLAMVPGITRIVAIGASESSNKDFVAYLSSLMPLAHIVGVAGSDWSKEKATKALEATASVRPHLVLIGLGMPRQEAFAAEVYDQSVSNIIAVVGGAIDQFSGAQLNAPRWIGRIGLEWAWRLLTQPRRLWKRYLLEPWALATIRLRAVILGRPPYEDTNP